VTLTGKGDNPKYNECSGSCLVGGYPEFEECPHPAQTINHINHTPEKTEKIWVDPCLNWENGHVLGFHCDFNPLKILQWLDWFCYIFENTT